MEPGAERAAGGGEGGVGGGEQLQLADRQVPGRSLAVRVRQQVIEGLKSERTLLLSFTEIHLMDGMTGEQRQATEIAAQVTRLGSSDH